MLLWLALLGPLWLVGWGVLDVTRRLNRIASMWCRFLLKFYPR